MQKRHDIIVSLFGGETGTNYYLKNVFFGFYITYTHVYVIHLKIIIQDYLTLIGPDIEYPTCYKWGIFIFSIKLIVRLDCP